VNLSGESLLGTDFSFEDVVPREVEGASHKRLPDEPQEGVPCFVVEAIPKAEVRSEYSRFVLYVEKEHYVPLRTRYWDSAGVEVKELRADPKSIRQFESAWIPMRAKMRHVIHETWTSIDTEKLEANPSLDEKTFEVRRLESH
jgi:outer membrane lipoprotein-sorting protein